MSGDQHHLIFIYGTLKTGNPNEHKLREIENGEVKYLCKAVTADCYPLIIITKHNIPLMLHHKGIGMPIKGEIYEIDDKRLQWLDKYENSPDSYQRVTMTIKTTTEPEDKRFKVGEEITCIIYLLANYPEELLEVRPHYDEYDEQKIGIKFDKNLAGSDDTPIWGELAALLKKKQFDLADA